MALNRLSSIVRVLGFYLLALVLLLTLGATLQIRFGLPGVILMQLLIFLGLPLLFTTRVERQPVRSFLRLRGLNGKGLTKTLLLGGLSWIMAQFMGSAAVLLLRQLGGEMVQPYQILLDAPLWLALFAGAVIPAISEEASFRGYVLGALRPLGPAAAVILTGLLFGALHLSLIRLIPLSLLGIFWAMVVQRSGSILPGMIMHFMNNGIAIVLAFAMKSGGNAGADLAALDAIPPQFMWVMIGMISAFSIAMAVAAYFIAASFSPSDLARPEEFEAGIADAEPAELTDLPPELVDLHAELAQLRQRRRQMLLAAGALAGGLILAIYTYAAWRELSMVFR